MRIEYLKLFLCIFVCLVAGFIGSIFTTSSIPTWYASLNKPFFSPPNWLFGPVWTLLYVLMGVSLYMILQKKKSKPALVIFGVQLMLNIIWPIIFFGLKNPLLAFVEIVALWTAILLTILKFRKISRTAAYILIPYICWVTFAAILNISIFILN